MSVRREAHQDFFENAEHLRLNRNKNRPRLKRYSPRVYTQDRMVLLAQPFDSWFSASGGSEKNAELHFR